MEFTRTPAVCVSKLAARACRVTVPRRACRVTVPAAAGNPKLGWAMADIVIRGGRVCDGNGGASFIGDGALLS